MQSRHTYRQEVADHFNELDEDNRRLVVRGDIKQWNQMLAETAHNAGVITNEEFAIFQNAGYMGLYGGLDVDDIHTKKHYAGRFANTGKSIQQIEKEQMQRLKNKAKKGKLMLDE